MIIFKDRYSCMKVLIKRKLCFSACARTLWNPESGHYIYISQVLHAHHATSSEIVASLSEQISGCNVDLVSSSSSVFLEKAGFFGIVRVAISFF
jgi:hypothetical protein